MVIQTTCWDEREVPKNLGKNIGDAKKSWMFGACLWFNRDMCGKCLIYASATIHNFGCQEGVLVLETKDLLGDFICKLASSKPT